MTTTQPRERAVACQWCWPRTRRTTWNTSAVCDDCTRLATLVERPTQITCNRASSKVRYSPQLDMQQVSDRYCLSIIAKSQSKSPLPAVSCTEADTATAWARWCRDHTGMTA